ncbi:MAG: OmpA family protein [Pseudomonadota bacterium]
MKSILIAAVLLITAATFYSAMRYKSVAIEKDIHTRVSEGLDGAGPDAIELDVDGRHVTLSGVVGSAETESVYLKIADETYGALGPIDGLTHLASGGFVSAVKTAAGITLNGTVPDEATRTDLLEAAEGQTDGTVVDALTVEGARGTWHDEARFGLGQLGLLASGTLTAGDGVSTLSGIGTDASSVAETVAARDGWQTFLSAPDRSDAFAADLAGLRTTLSARDARIVELQADLGNAQSSLTTLETTLDTREARLGALEAELAAERDARTALDGDLGSALAERDARIAGLEAELAQSVENHGLVRDDRDALAVELDALRAGLTEEQSEASTLAADLATAMAAVTAGEATISGLLGDIDRRDGRIAEQEDIIAGLEAEQSELQENLARLTDQAETGVTEQVALEANLAAIRSERDEALANLAAQAAANDDTRAVWADERSTLLAERDTAQARLANLEAEHVAAEDSLVALRTRLAAAEGALPEKETALNAATARATESAGALAALNATLTERDGLISALEAEAANAARLLADRDATIAALRARPETVAASQEDCAVRAELVLEGSRINFGTGNAELSANSVPLLERLTGIALACVNDAVGLEIGGHTDDQGTEDNNRDLSERRAAAVVEFMTARGVPADGLTARGYGESEPIADNSTEAGRAQNRRISFGWQAR